MRQQDYEILVSCINHGAPALAVGLIQALNQVVDHSNHYLEIQRQQAEQARLAAEKAEQTRLAAEKAEQSQRTKPAGKTVSEDK